MPKRKSLLKRVEIEVAQRKRTCKFTGDAIVKGDICITVYDGPRDSKGYCREIALQMIDDARQRLKALEESLT
jgi:hypothetical protein